MVWWNWQVDDFCATNSLTKMLIERLLFIYLVSYDDMTACCATIKKIFINTIYMFYLFIYYNTYLFFVFRFLWIVVQVLRMYVVYGVLDTNCFHLLDHIYFLLVISFQNIMKRKGQDKCSIHNS